jgi:hypothetical protein
MNPGEVQRSLERDAKGWAEVVKATGVTVN